MEGQFWFGENNFGLVKIDEVLQVMGMFEDCCRLIKVEIGPRFLLIASLIFLEGHLKAAVFGSLHEGDLSA